ncbi:MAG: hypothetical protein ABI395_08655 [Sphingobium sp.]
MLSVQMIGFWDAAMVAAYRKELVREIAKFSAGGRFPHDIGALVDLREQSILPPETTEAIQNLTESEWPAGNPAAVIISPSMIQKGQSRRMGVRLTNIAFFTDEGEAVDWLIGQRTR